MLAGHFPCTLERVAFTTNNNLLMLHNATVFFYRCDEAQAVGSTENLATAYLGQGQSVIRTTCGILMHSGLVVAKDGLPPGFAAIKFWSRDEVHGTHLLKLSINPTRVPIEQRESYRWLEKVRQSTALLAEAEGIFQVSEVYSPDQLVSDPPRATPTANQLSFYLT